MPDKIKKKQLSILSVLKESDGPCSSSHIASKLESLGHEISERTVRFYLNKMDLAGLTKTVGKKGRQITEKGLSELDSSSIIDRVGFLSAKIDQLTYAMDFDLNKKTGNVVVNLSLIEPRKVLECLDMMNRVFEYGFAMGHLVTLYGPGERVGHLTIPENMIGFGTVCSITVNGVLLKYGIPTNSRFGGLLELQEKKATRFVEIINYDGTSIDPLEVFIRSGMTDYVGAVKSGNGRVGASFREFPAQSRDLVIELAQKLDYVGLGCLMRIGQPSQTLLEVPVSEGRIGSIMVGGLNPVAILEETGVRVHLKALAGLVEFNKLFHYTELKQRLEEFL
jgi:repressor of nif and glnA expression